MKTALQQLADEIKGQQSINNSVLFEIVLLKIERLKTTERNQIILAYYAGTAQFANDAEIVNPKTPELYYEETFMV